MLTYAIGDIHGYHKPLLKLLGMIKQDADGQPYRLVFVGDYVDRGPESYRVVQLVKDLTEGAPENNIAIRGNHEQMMLEAMTHLKTDDDQVILENQRVIGLWLYNGGQETLDDYLTHSPREIDRHLAWLERLPTKFETEYHFFCHGGIRNDLPLDQQTDAMLMWARDWWCNRIGGQPISHPKHIVYGHTPTRNGMPRTYPDSTGVDTGVFFCGRLTAARFDTSKPGDPESFLQATVKL